MTTETSIWVDSAVRDRLAVLAAERGMTLQDLVGHLAQSIPTREELDARHAAATAYIAEHLVPGFGPDDVAAGEQMWRDLAEGRLTSLG